MRYDQEIGKDKCCSDSFAHRWAQLTQKLAPLTAIPLIEKICFASANPITQILRKRKLTLFR